MTVPRKRLKRGGPRESHPDPRYLRFRARPDRQQIFAGLPRLSWAPQSTVTSVSAYIHEDFETNAYQWRLLEAILAALKRETDGVGAHLVVMLIPAAFGPDRALITGSSFERPFETPEGPFTFRASEPRDRLAAITRRLGVWFFDPSPDFIRHVIREDLPPVEYFGPDEHVGDRAHSWLASELRIYLEQLWRLRPQPASGE
jgi:hypothetical protein